MASPLLLSAGQAPGRPLIGVLSPLLPAAATRNIEALREGLPSLDMSRVAMSRWRYHAGDSERRLRGSRPDRRAVIHSHYLNASQAPPPRLPLARKGKGEGICAIIPPTRRRP